MANELYAFIDGYLLGSRANRQAFYRAPEDIMDNNGLTDRAKQMVLFSMDRALICRYLLEEEVHEGGGAGPTPADYRQLVLRIANKHYGYDFDDDEFPENLAPDAQAAAWGDPEPRTRGVQPGSDSTLVNPVFDIHVTGEGIHHEARWIVLVQRGGRPHPHRIQGNVTAYSNSRNYTSRTLTASIDLTGAPQASYWVIVYNEYWWAVRSDTRFRVTQVW